MKYIVDIDGTICTTTNGDYPNAEPYLLRIEHFNMLYDAGNEIHYWTARGSVTGKNWDELTLMQLNNWGVKYSSVKTGKPAYDIWIDDKAFNVGTYFK
mgnify:FL=1|tara:strand:- start:625 stop:918 length:294 start_codon:yes stop_codon:yes gene_type:complete